MEVMFERNLRPAFVTIIPHNWAFSIQRRTIQKLRKQSSQMKPALYNVQNTEHRLLEKQRSANSILTTKYEYVRSKNKNRIRIRIYSVKKLKPNTNTNIFSSKIKTFGSKINIICNNLQLFSNLDNLVSRKGKVWSMTVSYTHLTLPTNREV